jgi:hypothetical protein
MKFDTFHINKIMKTASLIILLLTIATVLPACVSVDRDHPATTSTTTTHSVTTPASTTTVTY